MKKSNTLISEATAADVAQQVGVTSITVSRAFSGKGIVALKTRERIFDVARELGYRPNSLAVGLRGGRTQSVGLIWPFRSEIGDMNIGLDILQHAQNRGYATYQAEDDGNLKRTRDLILDFARRRVDALIIRNNFENELAELSAAGDLDPFPALVGVSPEPVPGFQGDLLIHDACAAIGEVVNHLADTGRKRPMIVLTASHRSEYKAKLFLNYCKTRHLHVDERSIIYLEQAPSPLNDAHYLAFETFFAKGIDCDAIFCRTDEEAIVAANFVKDNGLSVPENVAIIGFNDSLIARLWRPGLASIDRQRDAVTQAIEQMLFHRLEDTELPAQREQISMRFVCRKSADQGIDWNPDAGDART